LVFARELNRPVDFNLTDAIENDLLLSSFSKLNYKDENTLILKALALYPDERSNSDHEIWIKTAGTQNAIRGGYWVNGKGSGMFALGLGLAPEENYFDVGFRCVYCEE